MKRIACVSFLLIFLLCMVAYAHSGRTDSNGGHRDNKNKSGLGYYHYHCGGYPAHLHDKGYCPYTGKVFWNYSTPSPTPSPTPMATPSPTKHITVIPTLQPIPKPITKVTPKAITESTTQPQTTNVSKDVYDMGKAAFIVKAITLGGPAMYGVYFFMKYMNRRYK